VPHAGHPTANDPAEVATGGKRSVAQRIDGQTDGRTDERTDDITRGLPVAAVLIDPLRSAGTKHNQLCISGTQLVISVIGLLAVH
jgi:hypothetical protein